MSRVFLRKRSKNYIVYLEYTDETTGKKKQKNMGSYPLKRDASKRFNLFMLICPVCKKKLIKENRKIWDLTL